MHTQDTLLLMRRQYHEFVDCILSLPDALFLSPMNSWSPRDVVAHLIGWNGLMVESAMSILAGEAPTYYTDAPNDYCNINAAFVAKHSAASKAQLLRELGSSMERLEVFVADLPPSDLVADHGVTHYSGRPATLVGIIQSLAGDYQHHTRQIADWLGTK
jgi:hypothetical protein